MIMGSPVKDLPLTLRLTSTKKFIGSLLAREMEGIENPLHYLRTSLGGVEMNYSPIKLHFLALTSPHKNFTFIY